MAKVKYYVKESVINDVHCCYAVPIPNGTLSFDELCEEACENTSIEPSIMRAAITEYMKVVRRNVLKGFRVPLGEKFITVYPNLQASIRDHKDEDGNTVVVKADDLNANKGRSRLGATVSIKFSQQFANDVNWQRVDKETGAAIDSEDITDDASDTRSGTDTSTGSGTDTGSGTGTDTGSGSGSDSGSGSGSEEEGGDNS